jgi:uncharacterized protein YndB with AHSA1/START domain
MTAYDPEDAVVETVFIKASPERVFHALTEPSELLAWWGESEVYWCTSWTRDLRVGGSWRCEGTSKRGGAFSVEGRFLEIEPPRRLTYTWRPSWVEAPPTTVRITLGAQDGGTLLTWAHYGFRGYARALADHKGRLPTVVAWLRTFLEEGRRADVGTRALAKEDQ